MYDFSVLDIIDFTDNNNEIAIDGERFNSVEEFREHIANTDSEISEISLSGEFKHPHTKRVECFFVRVNIDKHGYKEFTCVCPGEPDFSIMSEIYALI